MAYISMMFVYFVIFALIFGVVFLAGLILLIIGIVRKHKAKNAGKKSPVVCIVIGSVIMGISACAVIVPIASTAIKTVFGEGYDGEKFGNPTDKWRSGAYVSDNRAASDAIKCLLTSADRGDRDAFAKLFTPNIQRGAGFEAALDDFFESYPVGLSECELDGGSVSGDSSFHYGEAVQNGYTYYTCFLGEEWYHIGLNFCYENTSSPDDVGVTFFCIENLEANALDRDYEKDEYLACEIADEKEVTARLIDGMGFIFTPTPERTITEEEFRKVYRESDNLFDILIKIGEANVIKNFRASTDFEYYYELVPEDGEPRYAHICGGQSYGEIYYGNICSETETLYDKGGLGKK